MQRRNLFGLIFVLTAIVLAVNFVSAVPINFDSITHGISDVFRAVFGPLFNVNGFDEFFFYKILMFIILLLVIKVVLITFPAFEGKNGIVTIISVAVALIATRYISELDIVKGILIPYGALAVTILTVIPFLIYFFFVHKSIESTPGRRIAWIFYIIVLVGIWANINDQLNDISNYIYAAMILLALCLIFFDRHVKKYFGMRSNYTQAQWAINLHLSELHNQYRNALNVPGKPGEDMRKGIMKEIKRLESEKHRIEA